VTNSDNINNIIILKNILIITMKKYNINKMIMWRNDKKKLNKYNRRSGD